jgi:hypothetical protein
MTWNRFQHHVLLFSHSVPTPLLSLTGLDWLFVFLADHHTFWLAPIAVFLKKIVILQHSPVRYEVQITSSALSLPSPKLISLSTVSSHVALRSEFVPQQLAQNGNEQSEHRRMQICHVVAWKTEIYVGLLDASRGVIGSDNHTALLFCLIVCYCFLSSLFLRLKLALITSYVSS